MAKGKFIVFDGVDGAGKTTQAQLLITKFRDRNQKVETYPEPGGTEIGARIRQLLLHDESVEIHQKTQTMLFMAARAELMQLIGCKIQDGINIVLDRWSYSTFAYQQDLTVKEWTQLTNYVAPGTWPDVAFWLDIPTHVRHHRLKNKLLDKFERLGSEYYDKVVDRYGVICGACPEMVRVDGSQDALYIHELVKHVVFTGEF